MGSKLDTYKTVRVWVIYIWKGFSFGAPCSIICKYGTETSDIRIHVLYVYDFTNEVGTNRSEKDKKKKFTK